MGPDSDHSSSCESLAEPEMDAPPLPPAASSTPSVNGGNKAPLPLHPRSAFISYVRRRGEPDGGRTEAIGGAGGALNGTLDSSLANTTDSEHSLSDGYATQGGFGLSNPRLGYASMRAPVRVSRPGGGGESDAAFTPSPPVTDPSLSLALAHQTRIRSLYSQTSSAATAPPAASTMSRRPDSSSSASSTTDWEGSGHATVLRRGVSAAMPQQQPPLPPPRPPTFHNLGVGPGGRSKPKIKLGSAQSSLAARVNKEHALFMDRLSVRTELSTPGGGNSMNGGPAARKPLALPEEEEVSSVVFSPSSLYFSQSDADLLNEPKQEEAPPSSKSSAKSLQDSMMRHMNRELTPSISEMYHERNLNLGMAPPLSKLLLSPNYEEQEVVSISEGCPPSAAGLKTGWLSGQSTGFHAISGKS